MLTNIFDGINWVFALSEYEKGNYIRSRDLINKMKGKRAKASETYALLGAVTLCIGDYDDAKRIFICARDEFKPSKAEYAEYVDIYCNYYLSSIDGRQDLKTRFLENAIKVKAPALIKRWLPLS